MVNPRRSLSAQATQLLRKEGFYDKPSKKRRKHKRGTRPWTRKRIQMEAARKELALDNQFQENKNSIHSSVDITDALGPASGFKKKPGERSGHTFLRLEKEELEHSRASLRVLTPDPYRDVTLDGAAPEISNLG